MNILILGGKRFLGIALVNAALEAGHTPTLFNRGKTNPERFPEVENLIGDRDGNLNSLKGREWDAVIDTSGTLPRVVTESARLLSGHCQTYVFISSVSVYQDFKRPDIPEDYPLGRLNDPDTEEINGTTFGPLKALCEYEIQKHFSGREIVIRPGLIVGPHDPTDRFSYWPWRVSLGGNVLAPAPPSASLQFIDVRDLAKFILTLIEINAQGVYNVTGPKKPATLGSLLIACREAAISEANFIWVDEKFLLNEGVNPWTDLPLWVPQSDPAFAGFYSININKALTGGLTFRSLSKTVNDTLDWLKTRPPEENLRTGLSLSQETAILLKYQDQKKR